MKRHIRSILAPIGIILGLLTTASCSDKFGDDLRDIGSRVEVLEESVLQINKDVETLHTIITIIESQGYVTDVARNQDGTYTITFNDGSQVTLRDGKTGSDGRDGKDGKENTLNISVAQDADGIWYWTLNGEWILDANGEKMRAGAVDGKDGRDGTNGKNGQNGINGRNGKDGRDGKDGKDGIDGKDGKSTTAFPIIRINETTNLWEISTDGGISWTSTGIQGNGIDGKDGANGKDGAEGRADVFAQIVEVAGGLHLVIILADGTSFSLPIWSGS